MTMTAKERVLAQIQHRETDYIPYTLTFESGVAERLDAYYGSDRWRGLVQNAIVRLPDAVLVVDQSSVPTYCDPYGSVWRTDRRPFHLEKPALQADSLKDLALPQVDALLGLTSWKAEALQAIEQAQDHFTVIGFGLGLFERIWALRGFDQALADAAADAEFYGELAARVADHQLAIVERLLHLPVDGIMFSDDWGYQRGVLLGPQRWRRFIKPHLARMYAAVHAAGKYTLSHCCGSVVDILPDIIEIGLDVLESVQPEAVGMNPYELKQRFGAHITFWGGLGSQSTIPFGTPAGIKTEVARLCREMGRGGGYILAPSKALQPETPTENAAAVVEAFLEQSGVTYP